MERNQKNFDKFEIYFECNKNSRLAAATYNQRFPDRSPTNHQQINRLANNLKKYGSVKVPRKENREFSLRTENNVLLAIQENPQASTREIGQNLNISNSTVHAVLKKHKFKSFICQKVQALEENDSERRLAFCDFYLNELRRNPLFYQTILWSDECTFSNNDMFNRNITRTWAQEHPRLTAVNNFQRRFSVNVWSGIFHNRLVGPFFIDGVLNHQRYADLLQHHVADFLDALPLQQRMNVIFQQDGAPPHNARMVTEWLDYEFEDKWMGTHGPIPWPARSPDLTPLDFWFWGYVKNLVFQTPRPQLKF